MGLPFTSLHIGQRLIASCDDGLLGPEYALFDHGDVVPRMADAAFVREQGYVTTAAEARARLSKVGVTVALAERAASALAPGVLARFARGALALRVVHRLGAYELFEGAVFSASTQSYEGAWLDLRELATALRARGAAAAMQALHLAVALSEVPGDAPVFLSTGGAAHGQPGERTYQRVSLADAVGLPAAITELGAALGADPGLGAKGPRDADDGPLRAMLLQRIDARAETIADDGVRASLAALRAALEQDPPQAQARASTPAPTPAPTLVSEPPIAPAPAPAPAPPNGPTPTAAAGPPASYSAELVESLSLPPGAEDSMLLPDARPTNALQARIACTRLARDLAREYRVSRGMTLRADALAVDAMQRHLRQRYKEGEALDPGIMWELQRHGALLSEIVARALGGAWTDIAHADMGYWAMTVAPSTQTWPVGRVYRFFQLGHREKDLVSYYLELESHTFSSSSGP